MITQVCSQKGMTTMRPLGTLLIAGLLFAAVGAGLAQQVTLRAPVAPQRFVRPNADLQATGYSRLLATQSLTPDVQRQYVGEFKLLPLDLQQVIVNAQTSSAAKFSPVTQIRPIGRPIVINPGIIIPKFEIAEITPENDGQPGVWSLVFGSGFNINCKVLFNGSPVATQFISNYDATHHNVLAFKPPDNATLNMAHQIVVVNAVQAQTPVFWYLIHARRGFRGNWGYQFGNFGDPQVSWQAYVDYFGHDAIYDAYGQVKPSAFWWYALTYSGVGGGGNCFGMSLSSQRWYHGTMSGLHHDWFWQPANYHYRTWDFPYCPETKETVQEDQGAQTSLEISTYVNTYWSTQDPRAAWTRIAGSGKDTILCMWSATGGHAVVPFDTNTQVGNDFQIGLYDNNVPYAVDETSGPNPTIAHVDWGANTFAYGGYTKPVALTYDECIQPPHLPANAAGSVGALGATGVDPANTSIVVVNGSTNVNQITDENGRHFYQGDGTLNQDPATRIPLSMPFVPMTGHPARPGDPKLFIFSNSHGKSLSFDLRGRQEKSLSAFAPGAVLGATGNGAGRLQLSNLGQITQGLKLLNPGQFNPTELRLINTRVPGERSFTLSNLPALTEAPISLAPSADGQALEIITAQPLQFNLKLSAPAARARQSSGVNQIILQAGQRALLEPTNWGNIQGGVRLQLRSLQGNQLLSEQRLQPVLVPLNLPQLR